MKNIRMFAEEVKPRLADLAPTAAATPIATAAE